MIWVIVETYYKHGEHKLTILYDESSLKEFLYQKIDDYGIRKNIEDTEGETEAEGETELDVGYLSTIVEQEGCRRVDEQLGWGVKEIRHI